MNDNTINESSKTEDTDNENDEIIAVRNRLEKRPDGVETDHIKCHSSS